MFAKYGNCAGLMHGFEREYKKLIEKNICEE